MPLYVIEELGPLNDPVLIAAFEGWVSAGSAGTATAEHLAGDGRTVATFDTDALFDYRANRPTIDFIQGVIRDVHWPEISLRHRRVHGRDLLVLSGTEPNWNWRRLADEVASLATRLGVVEHISLGGIPWATPHTRPTTIITTASDESRIPTGDDRPEGLLRAPGSAVSIVEEYVRKAGVPTIGFWARVPHYVGATYYPAVLTLVERIASHLDLPLPLGDLSADSDQQRQQLDSILESQPEARAIVERLESMADDSAAISGEELAAEIERFLQHGDADEPGFGDETPGD